MTDHQIPMPSPPRPEGRLARLMGQGSLFAALVGASSPAFATAMAGMSIGQFIKGDPFTGVPFAIATLGGLAWTWSEWRARNAYEVGYRKGSEVMREAAVAVIVDYAIPQRRDDEK